jgi:flagellin
METSMARLSTGKRINSAADDAAGVAIASRLTSEIRGTDQAIRNALDGQAVIDTAEGGHKEIENILQRMREVSVQAVNDTNSQADRANMQKEMTALSTEIDRIASVTTWAGQSVMSATTTTFSFQVGTATGGPNQISTTIGSMSTEALMSVSGPGGFVINGAAAGDKSGYSVSGAGDVNGDGFADLIVGSHLANGGRGVTSVVFGKADGTAVDLSAVGTGGFMITNTSGATTDFTGWTVSDAGDVNGDGLADLIVGSGTNAADTTTRESTVVFGKADSTAVDLAAIGTGGFVITGAAAGDRSG